MADVWRCELSYDAVVTTPNTGGNPDGNSYFYRIELHTICQPIADPLPILNPTVDFGHYCVAIGLEFDGTASMVLQMQSDFPEVKPQQWTGFFGAPGVFGQPGSSFTGGGTISITKDYDNDLLTCVSPVGTITMTLSDYDTFVSPSYRNTVPMVPQGYGARFTLADPTVFFPIYPVDYQTKFFNIVAKQNGVAYNTIALSAASPGVFYPDNGFAFEPGVGTITGVLSPFWTETQETTRQKLEGQVTVLNFPSYRIFDYFRNLNNFTGSGLDLASYTDHAALVGAWVQSPSRNSVKVRRSHDDGHSWTEYNAVTGSDSLQSVSVQVFSGGIYVLYYDASLHESLQTVSFDAGNTWSSPVAISITGTNPRLVIAPDGPFFYFSLSSGSIVLQRSMDLGATLFDAAPITVATTVPTQDFAALLAPDRTLVVAYSSAGNAWVTMISKDFGLTWSAA